MRHGALQATWLLGLHRVPIRRTTAPRECDLGGVTSRGSFTDASKRAASAQAVRRRRHFRRASRCFRRALRHLPQMHRRHKRHQPRRHRRPHCPPRILPRPRMTMKATNTTSNRAYRRCIHRGRLPVPHLLLQVSLLAEATRVVAATTLVLAPTMAALIAEESRPASPTSLRESETLPSKRLKPARHHHSPKPSRRRHHHLRSKARGLPHGELLCGCSGHMVDAQQTCGVFRSFS